MMDYLSSRHFIKVQLMLRCSSIYSRATEDSLGFTWCIWFYLVSKYHKVKYKKCAMTSYVPSKMPNWTVLPNTHLSAQHWVFYLYSFIEIEHGNRNESPNKSAIQKCLYKKSHHTPLQEPLSVCVGQLPSEELYYKCGKNLSCLFGTISVKKKNICSPWMGRRQYCPCTYSRQV